MRLNSFFNNTEQIPRWCWCSFISRNAVKFPPQNGYSVNYVIMMEHNNVTLASINLITNEMLQNKSHNVTIYLGLVTVTFWSRSKALESFCGFIGSAFLRLSALVTFLGELISSSLRKSLKLESDFWNGNNKHKIRS